MQFQSGSGSPSLAHLDTVWPGMAGLCGSPVVLHAILDSRNILDRSLQRNVLHMLFSPDWLEIENYRVPCRTPLPSRQGQRSTHATELTVNGSDVILQDAGSYVRSHILASHKRLALGWTHSLVTRTAASAPLHASIFNWPPAML
jgi:hypothetical protein